MSEVSKPNCHDCMHRRNVPGDSHSACANTGAKVTARESAIRRGWFMWPWNYDPVWLVSCNGFQKVGAPVVAGEELR